MSGNEFEDSSELMRSSMEQNEGYNPETALKRRRRQDQKNAASRRSRLKKKEELLDLRERLQDLEKANIRQLQLRQSSLRREVTRLKGIVRDLVTTANSHGVKIPYPHALVETRRGVCHEDEEHLDVRQLDISASTSGSDTSSPPSSFDQSVSESASTRP